MLYYFIIIIKSEYLQARWDILSLQENRALTNASFSDGWFALLIL